MRTAIVTSTATILLLMLTAALPLASVPAVAAQPNGPGLPLSITQADSAFNAGYQVGCPNLSEPCYSTPGQFVSEVKGTFIVPTLTCDPGDTDWLFYDVGTEYSIRPRDGAELRIWCENGEPVYAISAFINTHAKGYLLTVASGDKVQVKMTESPNVVQGYHSVKVTISDLTAGWTVRANGRDKESAAFATWYMFVYSGDIPNFGTMVTSGNSATVSGFSGNIGYFASPSMEAQGLRVFALTWVSTPPGHTLVSTSPLTPTGGGFSMTWQAGV